MRRFPVIKLKTLDHLGELLKEDIKNPRFIAGGTDVLIRIKDHMYPDEFTIIDISSLEELKGITVFHDHIIIGALTTHSQVEKHPELKEYAQSLVEGCSTVGCPQIKNRGTIGGNVGNASPAGDSIPPFYVLDAEFHLTDGKGSRWVKASEFFKGPGKSVLTPMELVKEIKIPLRKGYYGRYMKLGQRRALAISKVSLSLEGKKTGGKIEDIKIALGAVAPTVIYASKTEEFLKGKELTEAVIGKSSELVTEEARPITDIRSTVEYRKSMCGVLLEKALKDWK